MGAPTKADKKASWEAHRASGKPMSQWNPNKGVHGPKDEGRVLRSGNPMRSVRESLVSRAPGNRAAASYLGKSKTTAGAGTHLKNTLRNATMGGTGSHVKNVVKNLTTPGTLKAMAKAAGKVGGAVARAAAPPLIAYDVYDTAKTVHETVGAARELGRVRAEGRAAEQGTADIKKAMKAKYPMAGTEYEAISKKLPKVKQGTTIGGGILKVN